VRNFRIYGMRNNIVLDFVQPFAVGNSAVYAVKNYEKSKHLHMILIPNVYAYLLYTCTIL